jgi:hypothetical protein
MTGDPTLTTTSSCPAAFHARLPRRSRSMSPGLPVTAAVVLALVAAACGPRRPILYPNAHYEKVGAEIAEHDIDDCFRRAKESGVRSGAGREAAGNVGGGAAAGGAGGAVAGAISGGAGRGAAAGAAGGAVVGLFHWMFRRQGSDPTLRLFVERCLTEKGYELGGWR